MSDTKQRTKKPSANALAERARRAQISKDALRRLTPQQRGEIRGFVWEEYRQWGPDVSNDALEEQVAEWMEYVVQRGFAAFERSRARQRKFERINGRLPELVFLQMTADHFGLPDARWCWYADKPCERTIQPLDPDDPGDQAVI